MSGVPALRRLQRSLARLAHTRYPRFLFGGDLPAAEIPVFVYHDVTAEQLGADLEFLAANGYRALPSDEFHDRMRTGRVNGRRRVLLTFDDARRNFWDVAYPVLAEHGVRATLFAPSYWIGDAARKFMTWDELRNCAAGGLVDVESHGHRHALVYNGTRLAGFASPEALARHDLFDWPLRHEPHGDEAGFPPLGTPVYESAPLLSAERRACEPHAAVSACRQLVEAEGSRAFFARHDWEQRLRAAHDDSARQQPIEWLPERALHELIAAEIESSIACFRRELDINPRFFAYPWMLGSPSSLGLLRDYGMRAAFGVALDFRRARQRSPLPVYGRYKADWLRFLPGHGRRRWRDVVPSKLATFVASQHLAH